MVTWFEVPEYNTSNQNSFQVELFFNGQIRVTCQEMASSDGIAGISAGQGVPPLLLNSDLSTYTCRQVYKAGLAPR